MPRGSVSAHRILSPVPKGKASTMRPHHGDHMNATRLIVDLIPKLPYANHPRHCIIIR